MTNEKPPPTGTCDNCGDLVFEKDEILCRRCCPDRAPDTRDFFTDSVDVS